MYKNCWPPLEQREITAFEQFSCAEHLNNQYNVVLHSGRTFWSQWNSTAFSEPASYLAGETVLQPTPPSSAPGMFLTLGSDRGLSVSSRMLDFAGVNSKSGIWYWACALPFSYSHYQHLGDLPLPASGHLQPRSKEVLAVLLMVLFHINLIKTKSCSLDYKCYSTFLIQAVLRGGL